MQISHACGSLSTRRRKSRRMLTPPFGCGTMCSISRLAGIAQSLAQQQWRREKSGLERASSSKTWANNLGDGPADGASLTTSLGLGCRLVKSRRTFYSRAKKMGKGGNPPPPRKSSIDRADDDDDNGCESDDERDRLEHARQWKRCWIELRREPQLARDLWKIVKSYDCCEHHPVTRISTPLASSWQSDCPIL